ncbi:unnamed protein product [Parnassius apollo]|uniref:(apollo) hypothetical protein n=1 Tax=Parnassius apollo TaxID=110799 RepID=A0A8S3Y1V8_PARAO|nr:unnamed protein product [Parnassius apollo]
MNEDDVPSRYTVSSTALSDVYECILNNVKERIHMDAPRHCDFELKSLILGTHTVTGKKQEKDPGRKEIIWTGCEKYLRCNGCWQQRETGSFVGKQGAPFTVRYRLPEVELEAEKVQKEFLDSVERVVEKLEIDESNPILQSNSQIATEASTEGFVEDMSLMTADNFRNIPSIKTATLTRWHSILEMLESLIHVCNRDPINTC